MNLRSMTGFARVRHTIGDVEAVIGIKSVNHRGLDLHFYMGPELDPLEAAMRAAVRDRIARGHVDIRVQLSRTAGSGLLGVDEEKLDAYAAAFRSAAIRLGLSGVEPDLNAAFRMPGVLAEAVQLDLPPGFEAPFLELLNQAVAELNAFRSREGRDLGALLLERNAQIQSAVVQLNELRMDVVPALQARLEERLGALLRGAAIDPQRIAQEAAILADKSDIAEEIERLKIHSRQFDAILTGEGEAGKKLDFILQEMNRETNTTLSKTPGAGASGLQITELALAIKSNIEKLREQVLNLE